MKDLSILKNARIAAGINQKELGIKCGYKESQAQTTISRWESGDRPIPRSKIELVSNLLGIKISDLL